MDLLAPPCCATIAVAGDLGHSSPDTVTRSERYGQIKEMKKEHRETWPVSNALLSPRPRTRNFFATFHCSNETTGVWFFFTYNGFFVGFLIVTSRMRPLVLFHKQFSPISVELAMLYWMNAVS